MGEGQDLVHLRFRTQLGIPASRNGTGEPDMAGFLQPL